MILYSCTVGDFIEERWTNNFSKQVFKFRKKLNKSSTYMLIFGPAQEKHRVWFLAQPDIKLIYVSEKAVNFRYSRTQKRNTLVIFEKADIPSPETANNVPQV